MSSIEDISVTWLESIRRYVLDPDAKILDLHDLNLNGEEVESILEFLADSEICELDFSNNKLTNQMASLSKLLIKTKIKKLSLRQCELRRIDVMSLMRILKDSNITDLNISGNWFELPNPESNDFISYVAESHLTSLNLGESVQFMDITEVSHLIRVLCGGSITHLNLDRLFVKGSDAIMTLFHHLRDSAITHLSLARNRIDSYEWFTLGDDLRKSKLTELNLSKNWLCDSHLEELSKALAGTQITSLNLYQCEFSSSNHLLRYLNETQIRRLNLSLCVIHDDTTFESPNFLSGTSVVSLNLLETHLQSGFGVKIMKQLKSSKLEELSFHLESLEDATALEFFHVITETSVASLNLEGCYGHLLKNEEIRLVNFVGSLRNSDVTSLTLTNMGLCAETAKIVFPSFANSQFTHLAFRLNMLGGSLQSLAVILKFTTLTDLNLEENIINDNDAEALAACLKETRLITLNLGGNKISDRGAEFLALSLRGSDILSLNLEKNRIQNPGMEVLAKNASTTLITALKMGGNPGNQRIVETVTWNNRRSVLEIVRFFKQMAPEPSMNAFRFEDNVRTTDVDTFLEECLSFYDFALKHPSLSLVLSRDESISLGRDQIAALLFEEFPRQFVQFVATKIEAEISEHIFFLKKVEEMGLTRIVEHLLLNRPVYTIDQSHGILHPYVYQLLNKYKLPICNLDIEPLGIERIIKYFTEFSNIEGAAEVIRVLRCI